MGFRAGPEADSEKQIERNGLPDLAAFRPDCSCPEYLGRERGIALPMSVF